MFLPMDSPNQTKTPTSFGKADAGRRRLLAHRNPFSFRKPNNDISHSQRFPGTLVAEGHTRRGLDFFLAGGDPGRFVIETAQRGAKESFQQVPN